MLNQRKIERWSGWDRIPGGLVEVIAAGREEDQCHSLSMNATKTSFCLNCPVVPLYRSTYPGLGLNLTNSCGGPKLKMTVRHFLFLNRPTVLFSGGVTTRRELCSGNRLNFDDN